jgi:SAM-dependent methyltransferase
MDLDQYIRALERSQYGPGGDLNAAPDMQWKGLSPTLREYLQGTATRLIAPWSRRRARTLLRRQPLRLHLGSGSRRLDGWINIDLLGLPTDLAWDLRKQLPFPDSSADAVFHEHLVEHLPLAAALPLLRECHRVLRVGGILRVGVPDAERYIRDYVQPNGFIESFRPDRPTPLLGFAEAVYCYGHASLWDGQTLCLALTQAGLQHVSVRPFGDSMLTPAPDGLGRAAESVYAEGVRTS